MFAWHSTRLVRQENGNDHWMSRDDIVDIKIVDTAVSAVLVSRLAAPLGEARAGGRSRGAAADLPRGAPSALSAASQEARDVSARLGDDVTSWPALVARGDSCGQPAAFGSDAGRVKWLIACTGRA